MKRTIAAIALALACLTSTAYALYGVNDRGEWPKTWPAQLEPLRKQARTLIGPLAEFRHWAIRFDKRDDFEAAWPHLLTVKSKGAPIILVRGENFFLGDKCKAGIVVHAPPLGQEKNPRTPEAPIESTNPRQRYMYMTYIELVVDSDVVDLNRIELPRDTPIVDERFEKR
jgi:hypothetical protein